MIRQKFEEVAIIIPGTAKSAGTIIVMAADEILMEPASALGPIDAQIIRQGKVFSADALLKEFEEIKSEVKKTGNLNQAYIPMLQGISPGELQAAENAKNFAIEIVKKWLFDYKFKSWKKHSSTGEIVTEEEKKERAKEIASELSNHSRWLTHGRPITIKDLKEMGLKIIDYSENKDLYEALNRYYALLQITFHGDIYKLIETEKSQIYRFANQFSPIPMPRKGEEGRIAMADWTCHKCSQRIRIQANIGKKQPLQGNAVDFPKNNKLQCLHCKSMIDLSDLRRQVEAQAGQKVV